MCGFNFTAINIDSAAIVPWSVDSGSFTVTLSRNSTAVHGEGAAIVTDCTDDALDSTIAEGEGLAGVILYRAFNALNGSIVQG